MRILLISYNTLGTGMSGGDRINIEMVRRLIRDKHQVTVVVWEEGAKMYEREGIPRRVLKVWPSAGSRFGTWVGYVGRILMAPVLGMFEQFDEIDLVWSASDALTDTIPAAMLARRFRRPWLAAFYLFSPTPWFGYRGAEQRRVQWPSLRQTVYYLLQRISLPVIYSWAKGILVTGEEDRGRFVAMGRPTEEIFVVRGGLDLDEARQVPEPASKVYDAVFVGRFHPQKGVMELLEIWRRVCDRRQGSRLALIGVGGLEGRLRDRVTQLGMEDSVAFLGFMDGLPKFSVLKSSRVVVHPAIYDTGGMAPVAGLACGLPGVCFDLPSLQTYFKGGFLRASLGNPDAFAHHLIELFDNPNLYAAMSREAYEEAKRWDWNARFTDWWSFVSHSILGP